MCRKFLYSCAVVCLIGLPVDAPAGEPAAAEVVAYMEKMAASHKKLREAGVDVGKALGPALSGKAEDLLAANQKYRQALKVLAAVLKDTKEWKVPNHPAVKELARVNDTFLTFQVEMMLTTVPSLLDVTEDRTLDRDAKVQKLQRIIQDGNEAEKTIGANVRAAMAKAAKEFKIPVDR